MIKAILLEVSRRTFFKKLVVILAGCFLSSVMCAATPQRIVSTALTADEILVALLGDAPRLRAISALAKNKLHSNIYHLQHLPPTLQSTSAEHVVSLRPDLIVYSVFNRPEFVNLAQHLGINTYVLKKATRLEHILANITALGKKIGAVVPAQQLVSTLQQQLARVAKVPQAVKKPRVLNFFADNTVMGQGTMFDALVKAAGGINLAAQQNIKGFRIISTEILVTLQPDFIVIPTGIYETQEMATHLGKKVGWQSMRAVAQKKFIFLPQRELMATSQYAFVALAKIHQGLW